MSDSDLLVWSLESEISTLRRRVVSLEESLMFAEHERDELKREVECLSAWSELDVDADLELMVLQ